MTWGEDIPNTVAHKPEASNGVCHQRNERDKTSVVNNVANRRLEVVSKDLEPRSDPFRRHEDAASSDRKLPPLIEPGG